MKIDFTTQFQSLDGNPLVNQDSNPILLSLICVNSLLAPSDKPQSGEQKLKIWQLSKRISQATEPLEITPEELVLIRDEVARSQPPLLSGQAWELLS